MPRFLLVRHAESGTPGVYYGRSDVAVTDEGRRQEAALLDALAQTRFAAVVTSPLTRCRALAERIADAQGLAPEVNDAVAEIHLGDWEGRTFDDASNIYREIGRQLLEYDPALAFPGGESLAGFRDRVAVAWDALTRRHAGAPGPVLVVCHGGVIRALVGSLRHLTTRDLWQQHVGNCSATLIEREDGSDRILHVGVPAAEAIRDL
jgi:broad specificity phosphatase PhoE